MQRIIQISHEFPKNFSDNEVRMVLRRGGVIGFPTDTFYGLGVNPWNESAVEAIFSIKKRPLEKPILVLIATIKELNSFVSSVNDYAQILMKTLWPGPLTLLFEARPEVPVGLTAGSGKIGLRIPANPLTVKLIEYLGHPLTAPSANLSGATSPKTALEIEQSLGCELPVIIDGGPCPGGKPSTILDVSQSSPKIVRKGAINRLEIEKALSGKITLLE